MERICKNCACFKEKDLSIIGYCKAPIPLCVEDAVYYLDNEVYETDNAENCHCFVEKAFEQAPSKIEEFQDVSEYSDSDLDKSVLGNN